MYLRKSRPRTTCLYSAASNLTAQGVGRLPENLGVVQVVAGCAIARHARTSPLLFESRPPRQP